MSVRIEQRVVDAVLLVLASTGCFGSTTSSSTTPPPPPGQTATTSDPATSPATTPVTTTPVTTTPVTTTPVTTTPVTTTPADPWKLGKVDPRVATDPREFCLDYKKRTPIDKRKATNSPSALASDPGDLDFNDGYYNRDQLLRDDGRFDVTSRSAMCTLVRERIPSERQATHTPTCCPSGRGNRPCPPSQTVTVTDYKLLIERAVLRLDGSLASSTLTWQLAPHRFERHNCGRRPEGLVVDGVLEGSHAGTQLALMAELEAASVPAFERLARELGFHGAPAALVRRAQAAMRDEIRHARSLGELARRYGCPPRPIDVPALPCRSLDEIGRENAVEGCVREAFGALIATFQAKRAAPELRAVFDRIASDERGHVALAEDIDAWVASALDADARDGRLLARTQATRALRATLPAFEACDELGLPGPHDAHALFDAYFASALAA